MPADGGAGRGEAAGDARRGRGAAAARTRGAAQAVLQEASGDTGFCFFY